jgi:hypothetical protein
MRCKVDDLLKSLVAAMKEEFPFLTATDEDWTNSARSIVSKMGILYESGNEDVPARFYVEGIR